MDSATVTETAMQRADVPSSGERASCRLQRDSGRSVERTIRYSHSQYFVSTLYKHSLPETVISLCLLE